MNNNSSQPSVRKVGVLMFGRKRPGFDQEWSAEIRERCRKTIASLGYETVGADSIVLDDETVFNSLDTIAASGCEALIVIQPSLADGQYALAVSQRWQHPVILWATPERPGDGKVSSCSLVGQHLWASILRQARHPFEFVYGAPEEVSADLKNAVAMTSAVKRLKTCKVGMVGSHAPGFLDLAVEPFLLSRAFGLQLHPLSLPLFIERVQSVSQADVDADMEVLGKLNLRETGGTASPSSELIQVNSRYYVAMKQLMAESSLDALSIQCWPELPNMIGQWPYLAVSRLSSEGHAISIEGDVDGAISSLLGNLAGFGTGFLSDWLEHDDDTIFFWHPGMAPLDMCNASGCDDEPTVGYHFNGQKPFVVDGPLRSDSIVTVSRLWRCDGKYHATAFEAKPIPPRRKVTGNSLLVEVEGGNLRRRFDDLIHAALPHHVTLHFGRHAASVRKLARMLELEWHD
jgi:L-fucose isomerase-like protein